MFKKKGNRFKIEHSPSRRKFFGWLGASAALGAFAGPKLAKLAWEILAPDADAKSVSEREKLLQIIEYYYGEEKDIERTRIWSQFISNYSTEDINLTIPLGYLRKYSEATQVGYLRVLLQDYKKILDEVGHVIICLEKIKEKLKLRKAQKRNPKKYDVSNSLWNHLDERISINENTLLLTEVVVKDYLSVIITRAKLAHFDNSVPIDEVNRFHSELYALFDKLQKIKP